MKDSFIQIGNITPANLKQLKILNTSTLPVKYSDKFYNDLLVEYSNDYMRYAFYNGFVIGAICARIEIEDNLKKLYIMTLNVLPAYRRRGIASLLLNDILKKASEDNTILEVYLHVQINNEDAKNFYLHHNFSEIAIIKEYYKKLDPADCYLLSKKL